MRTKVGGSRVVDWLAGESPAEDLLTYREKPGSYAKLPQTSPHPGLLS